MRLFRLWRRMKYRIGLTNDRCRYCGSPAVERERGFEHEPAEECSVCADEVEADDDESPVPASLIAACARVWVPSTEYEKAVADRVAAEQHLADLRRVNTDEVVAVSRESMIPLAGQQSAVLRRALPTRPAQ